MRPRWQKVGADIIAEKGRIAAMIAAIAVSLAAVGAVLGSYALLTREMAVNYRGTRSAQATLEIDQGVDAALVARVKRHPLVAEAEARQVVAARARVGTGWRPLLLFVVPDFTQLRLNRFHPEQGSWPPPDGTVVIERSALPVLQIHVGEMLSVRCPREVEAPLTVVGVVHDPGLAPAGQERQGYGYITPATLAGLGHSPVLHDLMVEFRGQVRDTDQAQANAAALAEWLTSAGWAVHEIRVPPLRQHPHERQMTSMLFLMVVFATMSLLLSAILVATTLAGLMARHVREIGVMKALGARTGQIAGLYVVLVLAVGAVALVLAIPLAATSARGLSRAVAALLNFDLTSPALPWWVAATQTVAGLAVPLLMAAVPISRASRCTVRDAMDRHGARRADATPFRCSRLPYAFRNAVRRPVRLLFTVSLLAAAGAMFMGARNLSRSWTRNLEKIEQTRHYDLELKLDETGAVASMADTLMAVPGVRAVEAWGFSPAAFAGPGEIDVVHTYPDRGHGSLSLQAPPPVKSTSMLRLPVTQGRWLQQDDRDAVVLNNAALSQRPAARVGDFLSLSVGGKARQWRLVGVVEEVGSAATAYVSPTAFAAATGTVGQARLLRVTVDGGSGSGDASALPRPVSGEMVARLEHAIVAAGGAVQVVIPLSELRLAISGHIDILVQMLLAMALVMATVGMLGLASTMGMAVAERTREIGVMLAIGATPGRVVGTLVAEAVFIAALSWPAAVALSFPLTALLDRLVGNLGFLAPLPFALAPLAMLGWLGAGASVAAVASLVPATRAASLDVRDALA
jgi:putative ABC transport system permease protein